MTPIIKERITQISIGILVVLFIIAVNAIANMIG